MRAGGACAECGVKSRRKFCSESCRYVSRERLRRADWVNSSPECSTCGGGLAYKRAGAMFCDAQCKAAAREKPRAHTECVVCGDSISHLHKVAKYCGSLCQSAAAEDRVEAHLRRKCEGARCGWCESDISGLGGAHKYCSGRCKRLALWEYAREWRRAQRLQDVEAARRRDRDYYAANSAQVKAKIHRRRARVESVGGCLVTGRDIERLLAKPCAYCECCGSAEIDHVVPIARGGRNAIGNLVGACSFCNRSKNDKLLVEWRRGFREGVVSTHVFRC